MGLGADMCEWAEETGYQGNDMWSAWIDDLMNRAEAQAEIRQRQDPRSAVYCPMCMKQFADHGALRQHRSSKHSNGDAARAIKKGKHHTSNFVECSKCDLFKPAAQFSNNQLSKPAYSRRCRQCISISACA